MTLFERLCRHYDARPDRRGEVHVDCPFCGKEAKRGQTHFSFSEQGCSCFVCGNGGSLARLAKIAGLNGDDEWQAPIQYKSKPKPKRVYSWQSRAEDLAQQYQSAPRLVELWQAYKPVSEETIKKHRLGVGVFPKYTSRCQHPRLMVPLIDFDGKIVGFRGRRIDCDCNTWLVPGGCKKTLYNWQVLGEGQFIFIVENAIDALLVGERLTGAVAVATLSISYWEDAWLEKLIAAKPARIDVAFDNHRPGNGNGKKEWMKKHKTDALPMGIKLTNRLRKAGLPAFLFDWKDEPIGMDIGEMLSNT